MAQVVETRRWYATYCENVLRSDAGSSVFHHISVEGERERSPGGRSRKEGSQPTSIRFLFRQGEKLASRERRIDEPSRVCFGIGVTLVSPKKSRVPRKLDQKSPSPPAKTGTGTHHLLGNIGRGDHVFELVKAQFAVAVLVRFHHGCQTTPCQRVFLPGGTARGPREKQRMNSLLSTICCSC